MKKTFIVLSLLASVHVQAQNVLPPKFSFMQANNINTILINNGIYNYDKFTFPFYDAGFIWPSISSQRMTAVYASGIYLSAMVNGELRVSGAYYSSHFTGGNIPFSGQVPPPTVCSDSAFRVYLVSLTDESLVNGGTRIKTAGGHQYTFNYVPWAAWPVNQGAPFYEVNNIPGYQPGWNSDRPGIGNGSGARPDQLLFMVYMDFTNCTKLLHQSEVSLPGGTPPMGVEIHQLTFAFDCFSLENTFFSKYMLINKSGENWDSVYLGFINDVDIGSGSCGAVDDAAGCDTTRNLTFQYNADNQDCSYGTNPPALGTRLLQSPIVHTRNLLDTARLPYANLIGYKLIGMTSTAVFLCGGPPCTCEPDTSIEAFNLLKGFDICGNPHRNFVTGQLTKYMYSGDACNRIGWFDSTSTDRKFIMSSGPFSIEPGDTQVVVISFSITRDGGDNFHNVCAVQRLSDSALYYYYHDFPVCFPQIGLEPISSEVPNKFTLHQNCPNPFNPVTNIRFSIPTDVKRQMSNVKLIIYDILGREIETLINENLKPGTYEIDWNAENYPSGVYFYTISSVNFFDSKKMILLK